jgi:hypothetical protein
MRTAISAMSAGWASEATPKWEVLGNSGKCDFGISTVSGARFEAVVRHTISLLLGALRAFVIFAQREPARCR